jgi:hypothetical protein
MAQLSHMRRATPLIRLRRTTREPGGTRGGQAGGGDDAAAGGGSQQGVRARVEAMSVSGSSMFRMNTLNGATEGEDAAVLTGRRALRDFF